MRIVFVHLFIHGNPNAGDQGWTLINTGGSGFTGNMEQVSPTPEATNG